MRKMPVFQCLFSAMLLVGGAQAATADSYPDKPIRLVVPFGPGQATDILARVLAQGLSEVMSASVVVENRPGAGGSVGTASVARAAPDGYTLVMATIGAMGLQPVMNPDLPYQPVRDFAPITNLVLTPQVLVAAPVSGYKSLDDIVAAAKASPAGLDFASSGNGTSQHLAMELLKLRTGTQLVHVPFKGASEAHTSVMAGRTPIMFDSAQTVLPLVQSGKLTGIGIAAKERFPFLPDVPTMAELGYPDVEAVGWIGMAAPAGTPPAILDKLNQAVKDAFKNEQVAAQMKRMAFVPVGDSREEFTNFIKAEQARWKQVLDQTGVKIN